MNSLMTQVTLYTWNLLPREVALDNVKRLKKNGVTLLDVTGGNVHVSPMVTRQNPGPRGTVGVGGGRAAGGTTQEDGETG